MKLLSLFAYGEWGKLGIFVRDPGTSSLSEKGKSTFKFSLRLVFVVICISCSQRWLQQAEGERLLFAPSVYSCFQLCSVLHVSSSSAVCRGIFSSVSGVQVFEASFQRGFFDGAVRTLLLFTANLYLEGMSSSLRFFVLLKQIIGLRLSVKMNSLSGSCQISSPVARQLRRSIWFSRGVLKVLKTNGADLFCLLMQLRWLRGLFTALGLRFWMRSANISARSK